MTQIVLASGSPRRKEILEEIGLEFQVCPAKGEEIITSKVPAEVVMELASQKAKEVAGGLLAYQEKHRDLTEPVDILVIGADTVVAIGDEILGKPTDEEHAAAMLRLLSDATHCVYTGVSFVFISADGRCGEYNFYDKTNVTFYPMSEDEIRRYIASGEPMDKAGAYGIQGRCRIFIKEIKGDYFNVVGLPVGKLYQELQRLGFDLHL